MHRDGLTRCAAVVAMIGRCPRSGNRVILWTTPCRSRIGKGERRTGIACITRCRRTEARRGRTFNRLRTAYPPEDHAAELQSRRDLVCGLLLVKRSVPVQV